MRSLDTLGAAWITVSVMAQTAATAATLTRPDLVGALHFFAFAVAAGGIMAVLFHKEGDGHAIRRLIAGTLLAGIAGMAAGVAWAEWTGKGNIAMAVSVAAACLTVWGVSGRDVFKVIERVLGLWRSRKD